MIIPLSKFLPGITWFFIILLLICIPGGELPKDDWFSLLQIDKLVHIFLFGMLTILFCRPFRRSTINRPQRYQYFIRISLSVIIYGIITELIQGYFVQGRSFDPFDVVADVIGAFVGFVYSYKTFLNK